MSDPVLVGVLYDFPQGDGGASFEAALRLGIDEVTLAPPVELVTRHANGLPLGSAQEIEAAFDELAATDAVAVVGPSISDNCLLVRDLADAAGVPCVNYSGGEMTRSRWMFHYQVGSLAEEPLVLAEHAMAKGYRRLAVVHDQSPVGQGYIDALDGVVDRLGLEIVDRVAVAPGAEDLAMAAEWLPLKRPDVLVYLGLGVSARALAVALAGGPIPVIANSALMFGYGRKDWRQGWEGWVYVDTIADDNPVRAQLAVRAPTSARGPIGVAAYDMGRLLAEGIARAGDLTRDGVRDGLERVKRLPAASGHAGTTMGFGWWDHGALKGPFLVLRTWRGGKTVQLEPTP